MFVKLNGERHNLTTDNSMVVSFREKVWRYMNNVLHICDEDCLDNGKQYVIYNVELIKRCREQRYDEFVRWTPQEDDYEHWDGHIKNTRLSAAEIMDFVQDLENGVRWKELE